MSGGSDRVAGLDPLTIRQLEDRLQLAMAVNAHLTKQRGVSRNDMRVAMESLGVELPANTPLNSFTEQPSQVQYMTAMDFIREEEAALNRRILKRVKDELKYTLGDISYHIHLDKGNWEDRFATLKVVSKYLTYGSFVLPDNHADEQIQKELSVIHEAMEEWRENTKQLGQDVLQEDGIYQRALKLWEPVSFAIGQGFKLADHEADGLYASISGFTAAARQASHIEQENAWSATAIANCTSAFMETFTGPIPYKLQPGEGVEAMIREIDTLDDIRTLKSMLVLANAVESYLSWCWKLDAIRASALDCAITVCRQGGIVRSMMAA